MLSRPLKAAVLGFALFAGGCDRQSASPAQPQAQAGGEKLSGTLDRSHKGEPLPGFTLKDAQGMELALPELAGKPTLVNLWATWCGPCVIELPTLDTLAKAPDGRLRVIAVSQDAGQPEKVAAFLTERDIGALHPWLDPENDLSFHYKTGTLPTTILYDAEGREVWRYVGGMEWNNAAAEKMLAEAE